MSKVVPRKTARSKVAKVTTAAHDDKRLEIIERCANLFKSMLTRLRHIRLRMICWMRCAKKHLRICNT